MAGTPVKTEDNMNKKVIYTCLVGNYDVLRQPLAIDESYDYICFSNDIKEERVGVWQIRPIPFKHKDKARLSRYVKILPHRALEDYEWSLWMDANIQITKKLLKDTKMIMDEATSGKRALQMTAQKYYNVILLDYMMPDMNGVDTLRAIREQEGGRCKDSATNWRAGTDTSV